MIESKSPGLYIKLNSVSRVSSDEPTTVSKDFILLSDEVGNSSETYRYTAGFFQVGEFQKFGLSTRFKSGQALCSNLACRYREATDYEEDALKQCLEETSDTLSMRGEQ